MNAQPIHIVYVVTRADAVGGASVHVRDLAVAMQKFGHRVTVLIGGAGPVTNRLAVAGVPFRSLRYLQREIHPARDLLAFRELVKVLRELKPDLVSTHTAKAGFVGRAACRWLRIPVIYTPHGWTVGDRISARKGEVFAVAERMAAKWSAAIVCVCEAERKLAIEKQIVRPDCLVVVHNGMPDIESTLLADPTREPVHICSVARFEAPKDHDTLLNALSHLRHLPWQLELVGDGPLFGKAHERVHHCQLEDRVNFAGYVEDPAPILARSQLFVLSSRSEAFPRSILEAMRAGLPVVASDVGGVSEAVQHQQTGLLVPAGDEVALARALDYLVKCATRRQLFGRAGRQLYESRFRLDAMAAETEKLYGTVLNNPHSGGSGVS